VLVARRLAFVALSLSSLVATGCSLTSPKSPIPDAKHLPALAAPPEPAGLAELRGGLVIDARTVRLGQVMARLEDRLESAGIDKWTVYAHGDGFAVVTRLEHIDSSGRPEDRRFPALHPRLEASGFESDVYPQLLFNASTGVYRFFVFLVRSARTDAAPTASVPIDGDDFWDGELPEELGELSVSDHTCEVLVYELERGADHNQPARYGPVTDLSVEAHLVSAGIFTEPELAE